MTAPLESLLSALAHFEALRPAERSAWHKRVRRYVPSEQWEMRTLFQALGANAPAAADCTDATLASWDDAASALIARLAAPGANGAPPRAAAWLSPDMLSDAAKCHACLSTFPHARGQLLRVLALSDEPAVMACWTELIVTSPPSDPADVDIAMVPLFHRRGYDPAVIFPRLLDGLAHAALATQALDLANYLSRAGLCTLHPAAERAPQLGVLLGTLARQLGKLEEQPTGDPQLHRQTARLIRDSIPVVVALCDALALIGDTSSIGKLNQVLELRHRRLRCEAACALARLGEASGVEALAGLAQEPVVRSRALAYLDEVGQLDRAEPLLRTSVAAGEGELAAWLAEPAQFGVAPQRLELVESRTLAWPGYDEPVDCHLFRFNYQLAHGSLTGIGLAGPATFALPVDLEDYLPSDILAIYCGWHAEHPDMGEIAAVELTPRQRAMAAQWERRFADGPYEDVKLVKVCRFFGDEHLVFQAARRQQGQARPGILVIDGGDEHWYPFPHSSRPPGERELYWLHRGRKLLARFNFADRTNED